MSEQEVKSGNVDNFLSSRNYPDRKLNTKDDKTNSISCIRWFSEIKNGDAEKWGIKSVALSMLYQQKFSVPPGFVISVDVLESLLAKLGIRSKIEQYLHDTEASDTASLKKISEEVQTTLTHAVLGDEIIEELKDAYEIFNSDTPSGATPSAVLIMKHSYETPFVSVRSALPYESSSASLLDVKGMEALVEAIRQCYCSVFSVESLQKYLQAMERTGLPQCAIIIQQMINAEKSIKAMPRKEGTRIEAIWGSGDGFGTIPADLYFLKRNNEMSFVERQELADKVHAIVRDAGGVHKVVALTETRSKQAVLDTGELLRIAQYHRQVSQLFEEPIHLDFVSSGKECFIVGIAPAAIEEEKAPEPEVEVPEAGEQIPAQITTSENEPAPSASYVPQIPSLAPEAPSPSAIGMSQGNSGLSLSYPLQSLTLSEDAFLDLACIASLLGKVNLTLPANLSTGGGSHHIYKSLAASLYSAERLAFACPSAQITLLVPGATNESHIRDMQRLSKERGLSANISFGARIDNPAAVQLINQLCEQGIKSVEIDAEKLAESFLLLSEAGERDLLHPAILSALQYVGRRCQKFGIPCTLALPECTLTQEQIQSLTVPGISQIVVPASYAGHYADAMGTDTEGGGKMETSRISMP